MFMIESLEDLTRRLGSVYADRLQSGKLPSAGSVRGPVGLFLVRPDGAAGSKLAEEVVRSFGYWDQRTGHHFDGVFLGWGFDADAPTFGETQFAACVDALERTLTWRHSEGADLLLTDFVYDLGTRAGHLDFERVIPLDLSRLLDEKKLAQLSPLIGELIAPVRGRRESEAEISVWELSDYVGLLRTRRLLWQALVKKMGVLLGWADAVAPYAVRDLRRSPGGSEERRTH